MNETKFEEMILSELKRRKLTQSKFAEKIGLSSDNHNPLINYYIHGLRLIPEDKFIIMAAILSPDDSPKSIEKFTKVLAIRYIEHLALKAKKLAIPNYLYKLAGGIGIRVSDTNQVTYFSDNKEELTTIMDKFSVSEAKKIKFGYNSNNKLSLKTYINPFENKASKNSIFGLRKGMKLEEIKRICLKLEREDEETYFIDPPEKHSAFSLYKIAYDENCGLYSIKAESDAMDIVACYEKIQCIRKTLLKKYGDESGAGFNETEHSGWAIWESDSLNDEFEKKDLMSIFLELSSHSTNKGIISLIYTFDNAKDILSIKENDYL